MKQVKIALIGFGGIARSHYAGYQRLAQTDAPLSLVAVCDINPDQLTRQITINTSTVPVTLPADMHTYTDVDELIANEDFDMADICLPTYLHKEYTIKLLRAGKHVLCEKPMALSSADCEEMLQASRESGKRLMIGQCLRFDTPYLHLKNAIESGKYGKLRALTMNRLSALPIWGFEQWFQDTDRSGGCILDMHIHDVDMARFLLGEPDAVSVVSYDGKTRWQWENTRLFYDGVTVSINGSWDETRGTAFVADYRAVFEKASLIRSPKGHAVLWEENKAPVDLPDFTGDMYTKEIEFFTRSIVEDTPNTVNSPESACATVKLIEAMRESAARGGEKLPYSLK
ncbi:MAG: Gfo/Idh/MocA family oxidoreductase [Clostridia bacterium]|nr:Gfo/Idh/MocA family oxidoreductase [Clostridia bacterium]